MKNPVLWLELRIRIREKKLWIVSCLYLLCLSGISGLALSTAGSRGGPLEPAITGQTIFAFGVFTLAGLLIILGALAGAGAISQEREQRTLPALLNTPLSAASIVTGKLLSVWVFILWLAALSLPFLTLGVVWGAFEFGRMLAGIGLAVAAGMVTSTLAVGLSGFFRRSLTSYLATGAVLFLWLVVWPMFGELYQITTRTPGRDLTPLFYIFYYHHPVAPLVRIIVNGTELDRLPFLIIPYALLVWTIIGFSFFQLACRGLRRRAPGKP